jgi:RNA polymerase sigma-70 factor (ECF subfamily)
VARAVSSLPEEERAAIELAYFGGHTYREVATMLSQPEGTVKSRIRNGLRRMKRSLVESGVKES